MLHGSWPSFRNWNWDNERWPTKGKRKTYFCTISQHSDGLSSWFNLFSTTNNVFLDTRKHCSVHCVLPVRSPRPWPAMPLWLALLPLSKITDCLLLDISGALVSSSHLCCIKRMCPHESSESSEIESAGQYSAYSPTLGELVCACYSFWECLLEALQLGCINCWHFQGCSSLC